jgi:hypothetical protein
MHNEGGDSRYAQTPQPISEPDLRTEAPVSAVVDVSCHQEEINLALDAKVHNVPERAEGRLSKPLAHILVHLLNANERAVEM